MILASVNWLPEYLIDGDLYIYKPTEFVSFSPLVGEYISTLKEHHNEYRDGDYYGEDGVDGEDGGDCD